LITLDYTKNIQFYGGRYEKAKKDRDSERETQVRIVRENQKSNQNGLL
jgi:hypothetical protein